MYYLKIGNNKFNPSLVSIDNIYLEEYGLYSLEVSRPRYGKIKIQYRELNELFKAINLRASLINLNRRYDYA